MATQPDTAEAPAAGVAAPAKAGGSSLVPALIAVFAAPALTWAVCQFVLIPKLKSEFAAPVDGSGAPIAAPAQAAPSAGAHGKTGSADASSKNGYKFENVVVNLSGTMGTRYLKTTFLVTGADPALAATFDAHRPALVDVTLNVLSSLSLSDLEEAGSKNLIREKLIQSYNQSLGRKVAEQVFFSDFVVQ